MKTYQEHLRSTNPKPNNLYKRKPILRSSAIFPFMINQHLDTKILFLGYWLIKRNIKQVDLKIIIRNEKGSVIHKKKKKINKVKAFSVSIKKALNKKVFEKTIIGSIELEVFSKVDMIYPYPAFVVNFEGKNSSTVVHTCGRIYNDKEDIKNNSKFTVAETGIDILPDKNFTPFFSFVNGRLKIKKDNLSIQIINSEGEALRKNILLDNILPYQSKFVFFLNDQEKKFLNNKKGTVKIKHNFKGFFPRLLSGNIEKTKINSTLTHTYYDTSNQKNKDTYWKNPDVKKFYDSSVSFPLLKEKNSYSELVIYPNFPKTNLKFDIEILSENGKIIKKIKSILVIKKKLNQPFYLNIKNILKKRKIIFNNNYFVKLIANGDGRIPARLKFGLNLGIQNKYDIPSNICFNAHVPNEKVLTKPGTFKWAPIINKFDSVVAISNTSNLRTKYKNANIILKFWNELNSKCIEKKIQIKDNGSYWFDLKKNNQIKKFLRKKTGWITIQSDNPFVNGWYIEKSNYGIIGADHLF